MLFSVFGLVLIFVDIILVIVDLSLSSESRESVGRILEAISLVISFFFLIDVLLRIYVEGLVSDSRMEKHVSLIYCFYTQEDSSGKEKSADKKCCGSCFLPDSSKSCGNISTLSVAYSLYAVDWKM